MQSVVAVQVKNKIFKNLAQTEGLREGSWIQLPGSLSTIDIADDLTVIGTNANDDIYVRYGLVNSDWFQLPGKLRQVSTGGRDKYVGVTAS